MKTRRVVVLALAGALAATAAARAARDVEPSPTGPSAYYYMLAPDVGFVALIHPSVGDEASGFTAAESISVITKLLGS